MASRGFASMDPERRRAISALGGRAAHAAGTAHRWTPEAAREAGKKGGAVRRAASSRQVPIPYEDDEGPATQRVPSCPVEFVE